ncbi:MAG: pilus assembly protein TadG [Candidatus Aquicultor secundus]|uniref:Pilus assembly protein TadG n=1 Tax=Candidatus Aquicultor secundus TaxID=1973895 RepID=A0A2M7T7U1_9ACTN|nr:TadE/TadG family type IV pilus assembly protein [Candidatus Aquicultor secundus]NCO65393.1 pilus assembly protein [Solirubrobacter sp.]PIW21594.1 MAG: pilus assembly protein TadG [Candidatus Aquicultor secundus]PIX53079.1 MAG: pilus assembly protein TadG [Candidatus Aquicultor secundus]PIY39873.1 MAG: pilus assembly protein TadG [Candidatus Aquicultor secundus]PIZ38581.1 MAG: pilus assembly protein TadG [Candidatus Aquicultor secundus]
MSTIRFKRSLTSLHNENGASAVEFAIVLPLLLTLILGIMQFGLIFFNYISITHAAREGARWAALEQPDADVRAKVKNSIPGLSLADTDIDISPAGDRSGLIGEQVAVTVHYKTPIIAPLIGTAIGIAGPDITLSNIATQRIE